MDSSDDGKNFFKHVFNFDNESKSDILNILQYAMIAIVPLVVLNKSIGKYIPEADDNKGSLELSAEVIIQIIVTLIGLLIIHRMITFVPTYSGVDYPDFHLVYIILAVLMITMSLQTKLGEKVSILVDRLVAMWTGEQPSNGKKSNGNKNAHIKVSQPISGQPIEGTSISALPSMDSSVDTMPVQPMPNYDAMYRNDTTTPLVGASTPGMGGPEGFSSGPMAANEFLGGSTFGSSW
jgi:hypothetical protein